MRVSLPAGCRPAYLVVKDGVTIFDLEVLRALGSGLSGDVLLVRNRLDGKLLALKVIKLAGHDAATARKIQGEPKILQKVSEHRHVAEMLYCWKDEEAKMVYMLQPYLTGGSLFELFQKEGPMGENQMMGILVGGAIALKHIHQQLVVHG